MVLAWSRIDTNAEGWPFIDESETFETAEEVIAAIERLAPTFHEDAPALAVLRRENGDTLAVGIGVPVVCPDDEDDEDLDGMGFTVLNFARADNLPPTYTSKAAAAFPGT